MNVRRIERDRLVRLVKSRLLDSPCVALLGPRQCGKTTLSRVVGGDGARYLDAEDPADRRRLESPMLALSDAEGLVVVDEAQLVPELFSVLRVLVDRPDHRARYLLLGSASPAIVRAASESLAGRLAYVPMGGLDVEEVGARETSALWSRGGFPRSFLARSDDVSRRWRDDYLTSMLERDLRTLGISTAPASLRRLLGMIAHLHGGLLNASDLGRSLGVAHTTIGAWLDLLEGAFLIRRVQPWFENVGKRLVKSPKLYVRDSGLLHSLLAIPDLDALLGHPKVGASFEGFVGEALARVVGESNLFHYRTAAGAELDFFVQHGGRRIGVEVKREDAPGATKSMRVALDDLRLDRLLVVHPGRTRYAIDERIEAMPLHTALRELRDLER